MRYNPIKCTLNKFCKNDYLKAKLNKKTFNVNRIIFEGYLEANLPVVKPLGGNKPIPPLNTIFFKTYYSCHQNSTNEKKKNGKHSTKRSIQ
jgi:hypothetical protein